MGWEDAGRQRLLSDYKEEEGAREGGEVGDLRLRQTTA